MSFEKPIVKLFQKNTRKKDSFVYTVPSPDTYQYQWFWDSCFHAITLRHINLIRAKKEIFSLLSRQFDNGLIPHIIYWEKRAAFGGHRVNIRWGKNSTSTITQPPILAETIFRLYQKDKDLDFLKKIYPNLKAFYKYLLTERDSRGFHLIGIINPDESGEDNSPRFDIPLKLPILQSEKQNLKQRLKLVEKNKLCKFNAPDCMKNFFWVKDLPFNAFTVKNLKVLSQIANLIGLKDDKVFFENQAELIQKAMRKYMFDDNLFWSVYQENNKNKQALYKKIKVLTWAIFTPLYAGILTKKEAENLVDNFLLNTKKFWLHYPIPSVALSDPSFNPEGYWRGPTWISVNWFVLQGLIDYGFLDIAKEILKVSKYLIKTHGFREYFHPITGVGLGANNFTWGGLVLDMEKSLAHKRKSKN